MKARLLTRVTDFARTPQGLTGRTAEVSFVLTFLGSQGVRVQIAPEADYATNPYTLEADVLERLSSGHTFKERPTPQGPSHSLEFASSEAVLRLKLDPFRLEWLSPEGLPLCVDEQGIGTTLQGGETAVHKQLQPGERFIGLGEKTGPLDRRGHAYTHWNTDAFGYRDDQDPIYLSTPFYMGLHQGRSYGFYLNNAAKSHFNFGASQDRFASVTVETGPMDYVLMAGAGPAQILSFYTELTGRTPLPPRWALGLQQCRYSYYPDYEVTTLAETFRKKAIPADVIYLDIHYMDAYKVFTWHKSHFANPRTLMKQLQGMGFRVVVIFDPGVKVEQGYPAYDEGVEGGHFVNFPDGTPWQGQVWPGWCHFPDFTRPETRAWWAGMVKQVTDDGVEGFWTDMNEPATWGQRVPDIIEFEMEGQGGSHKEAHNLYGMQMARATMEGAKAARQGRRPFVLTRAGYSGIQRYAAVWTGDNRAEDGHMLLGVRLTSAMGLAGVGFAGMDIGGFVGDADRCLYARWITIGAFSPLCRIHTMVDSRDSEPWSYGEKNEAISRNFINLRYRLMPLFYSLFKELEDTGLPVQRSLALSDPYAWQTYDHRYHNQFMLGEQILVNPCSAYQDFDEVFLPERGADWYYLYEDTRHASGERVVRAPLDLLPVFIAPGSVVAMRSLVQHDGQDDDGTLTLHLYRGSRLTQTRLFWDAGDGYGYQQGEQGLYHDRRISYQPETETLTLAAAQGQMQPWQRLQLVLHGFEGCTQLTLDGKVLPLTQTRYRFVDPLPAFDPFGNDQTTHSCPVLVAEVGYEVVEMVLGVG